MTRLAGYRTPRQPRHSVLDDVSALPLTLLKRRLLDILSAHSATSKKVLVDGVGMVVMKKERRPRGKTRKTITINGKRVNWKEFVKAIDSGKLSAKYSGLHVED